MIRLTANEFWPRYRDEVRRTGSLDALSNNDVWTCVAIQAAKAVCEGAGLRTCHELHLDVMGYEQRVPGVNFNWDLRVAFEHENWRNWQDEFCKLCHVVADLRVLAAYFTKRQKIEETLQERIDVMDERVRRLPASEWLFIFGPEDSRCNPTPWIAFTLDGGRRLVKVPDENPFCPYVEFSGRNA